MADSQAFKDATDFIKFHKKIKFTDLADELGVEKHAIDNARRSKNPPKEELVEALVEKYPETKQFFVKIAGNSKNDDTLTNPLTFDEPMEPYRNGSSDPLKELVDTQKKLILRLELENQNLKKRLDLLEGENRVLKEIITKRK